MSPEPEWNDGYQSGYDAGMKAGRTSARTQERTLKATLGRCKTLNDRLKAELDAAWARIAELEAR